MRDSAGRPVLIAQLNNCNPDKIPAHPKYFKPDYFALKKFRVSYTIVGGFPFRLS